VKRKLIYDVGMNNGDDTAYYLARGFQVIAIEANPALVQQASKRFEQAIAAAQLRILNVGIADGEGAFPFLICDTHPEWSTFDLSAIQDKSVEYRQITVSCRRFRSILEEFGIPYYLKLDIEGNEIHCLRDLFVSDLPGYVSFEKTALWSLESLTLLQNLGYSKFKLISQHNYLPVEYPPSRQQKNYERLQALLKGRNFALRLFRKAGGRSWLQSQLNKARCQSTWEFLPGSSGPFGEDAAGRWQSFDGIIAALEKANHSFEAKEPSAFWNNISYSFWADFHAKRES